MTERLGPLISTCPESVVARGLLDTSPSGLCRRPFSLQGVGLSSSCSKDQHIAFSHLRRATFQFLSSKGFAASREASQLHSWLSRGLSSSAQLFQFVKLFRSSLKSTSGTSCCATSATSRQSAAWLGFRRVRRLRKHEHLPTRGAAEACSRAYAARFCI